MQAVLSLPAPYISPFSSVFVSLLQPILPCPIVKINTDGAKSETSHPLPERKRFKMPKPRTQSGEKNLISQRLIELRRTHNMSQRDLAYKLQLAGYDMDKNVITRIETNKRYVTDLELKAIAEIFQVSYIFLIDGKDE